MYIYIDLYRDVLCFPLIMFEFDSGGEKKQPAEMLDAELRPGAQRLVYLLDKKAQFACLNNLETLV